MSLLPNQFIKNYLEFKGNLDIYYLLLVIGDDEVVSSISNPEEFSSPHTSMYLTNVLFPDVPMTKWSWLSTN